MSNKKSQSEININGNVSGGNINIGGKQTIHGNVRISLPDLSKTIDKGSASEDIKGQLRMLIDQLNEALIEVPSEHTADATEVAKQVEGLVTAVSESNYDAKAIETKVNLLKKAADNIKEVLPVVLMIATNIVTQVLRITGSAL